MVTGFARGPRAKQVAFAAPIGVSEIVLAIWLIASGFPASTGSDVSPATSP